VLTCIGLVYIARIGSDTVYFGKGVGQKFTLPKVEKNKSNDMIRVYTVSF